MQTRLVVPLALSTPMSCWRTLSKYSELNLLMQTRLVCALGTLHPNVVLGISWSKYSELCLLMQTRLVCAPGTQHANIVLAYPGVYTASSICYCRLFLSVPLVSSIPMLCWHALE